jgi:uncharacterized protein
MDTHTVLLHCAQGSVRVSVNTGEPIALETGDTLRIDHARVHIDTEGSGALLAIALKDMK